MVSSCLEYHTKFKTMEQPCNTYVPNPVPFDVVRELYEKESYEFCKTRIISWGMGTKPKKIESLRAVCVDKFHPDAHMRETKIEFDYHVFNQSDDGTYFYVYDDLFYRVLVWSKHPTLTEAIKGIVGQHTTLGLTRRGTIDVHSTIYRTDEVLDPVKQNKSIHVFNSKMKIKYTVQDYDLVKVSPDSDPLDMAEECWDSVLCFYDSKQKFLRRQQAAITYGGGKASSVSKSKARKRREVYAIIPSEITLSTIRTLQTKEIVEKAASDMKEVYNYVKKNSNAYGMVRIPYISNAREKEFVKQINKHVRKDINTLLVTDPQYKSSVMLINFDMFTH